MDVHKFIETLKDGKILDENECRNLCEFVLFILK
jgi:hypothetical protein